MGLTSEAVVETSKRTVASRTYLTNATLVLPDETIRDGSLLLEEGRIVAVCPDRPRGVAEIDQEIDLEGDLLMPGIIDLHSDALEHELEPRPGALLSSAFAVTQGDRKAAIAGITTTYHALYFGVYENRRRTLDVVGELARCMHERAPYLVVDNRVHCRFEVVFSEGIPAVRQLLEEGVCTFVALNNHSLGQGQMRDIEGFRASMKENHRLSDEEIDRMIRESIARNEGSEERAAEIAALALQYGQPLASHDDDTAEVVERRKAQGVTIAEFPVTFEAARRAKELGLHALMGAPNVMRGGSNSRGIRAIEVFAEGLADCLCSDYVPAAILPAVFKVAHDLGWPLHRAVCLATLGPARAARLSDRGAIAPGLRADLIAVRECAGVPIVRRLWSNGRAAMQF